MAIEDRALVALSIAFTASIVAYPDLPADIPPRAGVDGAFVGAPFVAFFLPVAAAAIWWIVASLSRHPPPAAPNAGSIGPATALFLSAFHVTTLAGFLGGQPWAGRMLGAMVGVFLIATGNQLPRLRPNPVWGIRTRQTLSSDDLWRRVHRLGGYIRVLMGLGLCAAALTGMRGFAPLIVVAVAVETVVCLGAALLFSRRKSALAGLIAIGCCGIGSAAQAQGMTPGKIDGLPAFIDVEVPRLMAEGHVPGAALVSVHNGRIVLLRGYGQSRLDSGAPVDASRTLFRIGSVSKLFAAVAALQLADAGTLDLQRDIREYVPDARLRYGVTTHQLLTHVSGLLQRFAGGYTDAAGQLQPLPDHLRRFTPAQVRPPGQAYSYSNYNTALTGLVIERLSGRTYADYLAGRIIEPLKMTGTTARQPPEPNLAGDLARGYRWTGGRQVPIAYNYTQTVPAGGVSATAADMGRLMLALLGDGSVDGERILTPASVKAMLAPQFTPDPHIPARAYEMTHWAAHGQYLLHKDGTLGDQVAVMLLAPADRFGIFIASNASPEVSLGNQLLEPLLTYLFGPAAPTPPPAPLPDARARAPRYAGSYRSYSRTRDEMSQLRALMPILQSRVAAEADGAIRWNGRRWLEVEPLLFRSVDSPDHIVFRENGQGDIVELAAWGATYERVGWREQAPFHLAVLAICSIAFLAYPLARGLRAFRRRPIAVEGRLARGSAVFVALANLAFVAGVVWSLRDLGAITPLPLPYVLLLSLPIASVAATALLPAFAARAWRDRWWTRGERLGYSAFAVLAVTFMTFLNYWKLLGIRY